MNKELVTVQGWYDDRGGVVRGIGKLMDINDQLFELQKCIGRQTGVTLDFQPMFKSISEMIEQLRVRMDKDV